MTQIKFPLQTQVSLVTSNCVLHLRSRDVEVIILCIEILTDCMTEMD